MTASSMDRFRDTRPRRQDPSAKGNALVTRSIARAAHPIGSPENAAVRRYLSD
jgi:hypothetical protein